MKSARLMSIDEVLESLSGFDYYADRAGIETGTPIFRYTLPDGRVAVRLPGEDEFIFHRRVLTEWQERIVLKDRLVEWDY